MKQCITCCKPLAKGYDDYCEDCCEHGDMDEGYCLDCGADRTEELSALAYDRYKDFMKYGDD